MTHTAGGDDVDVTAEAEGRWRAGVAAAGVDLVDVDPARWTPAQIAEHDAACQRQMLADETRAAADPDDWRDYE